jgi:glycosyltransferase involved in cell wall biosynthesis
VDLRITTDIQGLERVAPPGISITAFPARAIPQRWKRNFALLRAALRSDHLLINFFLPELMFFTFFLSIIPFHRCRITTLDFFIGNPKAWMRPIVGWSLSRVSRFLVYFRDSSYYESLLGLPRAKFFYVPFKINAFELVRDTPATDEGYVFSGGRSRRDFATFFAAVGPLGYPVKMVTGDKADLGPNGSSIDGLQVPANVEILSGDSSPELFVRTLAASRFVVIPLVRDSTTQAGIGAYLQAMAQRKCVIVSSGLGVSDVLTGEEAIVVPAGDVEALRAAIRNAWEDASLRERYAENAWKYAFPLGGEDQLRASLLRALPV